MKRAWFAPTRFTQLRRSVRRAEGAPLAPAAGAALGAIRCRRVADAAAQHRAVLGIHGRVPVRRWARMLGLRTAAGIQLTAYARPPEEQQDPSRVVRHRESVPQLEFVGCQVDSATACTRRSSSWTVRFCGTVRRTCLRTSGRRT
ncbi:hypothetical protein GCM10010392_31910 [Streptomyces clavifer]|nr:hypothetical protein GCM10010392_31910 [Streptomyces clavifer]